jgi:hypothetical protein
MLITKVSVQQMHCFLPAETSVREAYTGYFSGGMGVAEWCKFHEGDLEVLEKCREENFSNGRMNRTERTVMYWRDQWRLFNLEPRTGTQHTEVSGKVCFVVKQQTSLFKAGPK